MFYKRINIIIMNRSNALELYFKMQINNETKHLMFDQIKNDLVPHFQLLALQVRSDIQKVIQTICDNPTKEILKKISRQGLLQQAPLLRSLLWKLLLQTLPLEPQKWEETQIHNQILYKSLVDKFLGSYIDEQDLLELGALENSAFDQNLWNQIQLDTKRTHSTLNFFQKQINHTKMYLGKVTKNHDLISRILYIWGKINPTVRYVQGMNQIVAPLYYLQFQGFNKFSQSQVFFMFASIMSFVIDMHIKQMDECNQGIMGKMRNLNNFVKVVDFSLWEKLDKQSVAPQYYSFRWLALLLAQEFGLCQTMNVWDVLLSYQGYKRYFYLFCCCVSILKLRKKQIMQGDFISILPQLQKLRNINVPHLLKLANKLYQKYSKVNIFQLAKQIQAQKKIQNQKQKIIENETKGKSWSYGDLVKNTANYLSKLMPTNQAKKSSPSKQLQSKY